MSRIRQRAAPLAAAVFTLCAWLPSARADHPDDAALGTEVLYGAVAFEAVAAAGVAVTLSLAGDDLQGIGLAGTSLLAVGAGVGTAVLAAAFDWPSQVPAAIHLAAWGAASALVADLFLHDEVTPLFWIGGGLFASLGIVAGLFADSETEAMIAAGAPIGLGLYLGFMLLGGIFIVAAGDDDTQLAVALAAPITVAATTLGACVLLFSGVADDSEPAVAIGPLGGSVRF